MAAAHVHNLGQHIYYDTSLKTNFTVTFKNNAGTIAAIVSGRGYLTSTISETAITIRGNILSNDQTLRQKVTRIGTILNNQSKAKFLPSGKNISRIDFS